MFAVPGPITSKYSRGTSKLLKNGAKLVESVDDIIEELKGDHCPVTSPSTNLSRFYIANMWEATMGHIQDLPKADLGVMKAKKFSAPVCHSSG